MMHELFCDHTIVLMTGLVWNAGPEGDAPECSDA